MDKHLLAKIGQYAIICDEKERVLILQRARSGVWCLPGGRLDQLDKNPLQALAREIKEELNLKVINSMPIQVDIVKDQYQIKYCVYFLVQVADLGKFKISNEHKDYKFVDYQSIAKLKVEDKKIKEILKQLI